MPAGPKTILVQYDRPGVVLTRTHTCPQCLACLSATFSQHTGLLSSSSTALEIIIQRLDG